ncbi:hypothetical protein RFI_29127 [Reticulomyxa filosa]|uniref:Uncharacterized protein n=1 Tax=Reticulomyxa filosa TaxID=46433 RepID=X6M461_RETFI|nr:hypothetical protein RFI_29127 [Reticulomyxa filosa]|eukprot:ETO08262.1 hypothetical protein RFI_29127 [Reticulomyxa filosa]
MHLFFPSFFFFFTYTFFFFSLQKLSINKKKNLHACTEKKTTDKEEIMDTLTLESNEKEELMKLHERIKSDALSNKLKDELYKENRLMLIINYKHYKDSFGPEITAKATILFVTSVLWNVRNNSYEFDALRKGFCISKFSLRFHFLK